MNIWDIAVLLAVALLAVRSLRRSRKRGCGGCCASCGQACVWKRQEERS